MADTAKDEINECMLCSCRQAPTGLYRIDISIQGCEGGAGAGSASAPGLDRNAGVDLNYRIYVCAAL